MFAFLWTTLDCASLSVCFAVWKNRHMRTVTNYFIVNLSLADVLVTIICLPASLVVDITETWFFGNTLCKIVPYLQVSLEPWHLLFKQDIGIVDLFRNNSQGLWMQAKTHISIILPFFFMVFMRVKKKKNSFSYPPGCALSETFDVTLKWFNASGNTALAPLWQYVCKKDNLI